MNASTLQRVTAAAAAPLIAQDVRADLTFIRPQEDGGLLRVDNGLLLRADLKRLFNAGYLTVTTKGRVQVSQRLAADYGDGGGYGVLDGREISAPEAARDRPRPEFLAWHRKNVFRGIR